MRAQSPFANPAPIFGYPIRDTESGTTLGGESDPGGLLAYRQEGWPMTKRLTLSMRVVF